MTFPSPFSSSRLRAAYFIGFLLAAMLAPPTSVFGADLVARTRIRISLVQWMPTAGQYQNWSALGGDYEIGADGTLQLPIIGSVAVAGKTTATLAEEIAKRVKAKIGLVSEPSATVQIVSYPPVYVVGDVSKPGEYPFHEGQTVLQALALGGGMYRSKDGSSSADVVNLVSTIQGTDDELLRTRALIARLKAEFSGAKAIVFPALPKDEALRQRVADIFDQERVIFASRTEGLDRQIKSLNDLQRLLHAEIDTLQTKVAMTDEQIQSTQKELSGVKVLVKKGIAVASHQNDLQAQLANYQASRLDNLTAIMRARQSITEAKRNLQALQDNSKTDVAGRLQQAQERLEALTLKRQTTQKLLIDTLANGVATAASGDVTVTYRIVRAEKGGLQTIDAREETDLQPGDVLKVIEQRPDHGGTSSRPQTSDRGDMKGAGLPAARAVAEHGA